MSPNKRPHVIMNSQAKDELIKELRDKLYELQQEDRDLDKLDVDLDVATRNFELAQAQRFNGQRQARNQMGEDQQTLTSLRSELE